MSITWNKNEPVAPVVPPATASITWGEFLKVMLPVLVTLAVAIGSYYEARQAHLEAVASREQSHKNGRMLEKHLPIKDSEK